MTLFSLNAVGLTDGERTILHDISCTIPEHCQLTITGPSGGGKSSLLRLLAILQSPSSGRILYRDQDLNGLDPVTTRREIAYCFQQPVLFGQTVRDNLRFPFEIRKQPFDQAAEAKAGAALEQVSLPADLLDHDIATLSGGEKQRVSLTRSLLFLPRVLLLDEVTAGLDAQSRQVVRQLVAEVWAAGVSVIAVTHESDDLAEAEERGDILIIEDGTITGGSVAAAVDGRGATWPMRHQDETGQGLPGKADADER